MAGNDQPWNPVNLTKWRQLHPLLTYADPADYASYEWFTRGEDGHWVSGDCCKLDDAQDAGTAELPAQQVIPASLAPQFLSADGRFWSAWQELSDTEVLPNVVQFEIRHRFAAETATVAMHYPYTYTMLQQYLARLLARQYPGVSVDRIGVTAQGRELQVIRIEDPRHPAHLRPGDLAPQASGGMEPPQAVSETHRVIMVIAREHGAEHSSSWAVHGMVKALLSGEAAALREHTTWLLVPIFDPDGSANSLFYTISTDFYSHSSDQHIPPEVLAYVRYLRAFVNAGCPIQAVASFYNLECNEGEVVSAPFIHRADLEVNTAFNQFWFSRLAQAGLITGKPAGWQVGVKPFRLTGWTSDVYGALPLFYEVNDRYPACRLTLRGLEDIGGSFVQALTSFLSQPIAIQRLQTTRDVLTRRAAMIDKRLRSGRPPEPMTAHEMITLGY